MRSGLSSVCTPWGGPYDPTSLYSLTGGQGDTHPPTPSDREGGFLDKCSRKSAAPQQICGCDGGYFVSMHLALNKTTVINARSSVNQPAERGCTCGGMVL